MTLFHKDPHITAINEWLNTDERSLAVVGLSGSAQAYFFSCILRDLDRPCLAILPDGKRAERLYKGLRFFMGGAASKNGLGGERLQRFFAYDMSPLTGLSPHRDLITQRIKALYALSSEENPVVVTSMEALSFRILPKTALLRAVDYLEPGEEVDREQLVRRLGACGYQRTSLVEERGDYSVRGGVIDIFSPLYSLPIRLEFWGDRLESIRPFDPISQRSQGSLDQLVLLPASEIIMDGPNVQRARSMGRLPAREPGMGFPGQEAWLNHFYETLDTLFDYLPETGIVAVFDPHRLEPEALKSDKRFQKDLERFREESAARGDPFPEVEGIVVPFQEISRRLESRRRMSFSELSLEVGQPPDTVVTLEGRFHLDDDLHLHLAAAGRVSLAPFAQKAASWLAARARVVITCSTEQQANRMKEILANYDMGTLRVVRGWEEVPEGPGLSLCLGRLEEGFAWPEMGLYVVSEADVFGEKAARAKAIKAHRKGGFSWSTFSQLQAGDLVVHEEHGIGRYGGLLTMEIAGRINDFVVVEYAGNSKLYIPADRVSVLQKYAGADESLPKLDQLGGNAWNIAKQKASKSVRKIARQLVELYALRKYRKGFAFSPPDNYFREFEAAFEHEETDDQIRAIEDVLSDLCSERPMDRLVCGDVGFGKTEIALRAAFKAVLDGKQVAFLVPTTVLAEQHFETFQKRMAPYGVDVGVLSRFKTQREQAETAAKIRSGKIQVVIGTHRILQKDVKFADLGLLIIDEEQRFGVRQKELLKRYRALVDVLAITATPVPRTLQMSMIGVRDLSVIETPPQDRQAIETYLSPYDESLIVRAIESEMERGGQAFFVHNQVRSIDTVADRLRHLVPRARLAVAHGQMKSGDLEEAMLRFLHKEIDLLVCSTIIESGLDIPSANTIIINQAERLGLAQIYQLRGRVGRAKEKAYAYLLISKDAILTRDAEKRLRALMDFTHLGAGLHLAMHDLKIRGGGNILGFSQSGHISAIGYELYIKLIERAVAELKGTEWQDDVNPEIHIDLPAYLPAGYVMDTDVRLNLYRRLSSLLDPSELNEIIEEIKDRFGPPPPEADHLFGLMSIRLLMKRLRIEKLEAGHNQIILTLPAIREARADRLIRVAQGNPRKYRFLSQDRIRIHLEGLSLPRDFGRVEKEVEILAGS